MNLKEDKKGQGLSTNAIILIILGVIILVILIIGFTIGWKELKDRFFKSNNVDTIVKACGTACTTNSKYEFCSQMRELRDEDGNKIKTSCDIFSNVGTYFSKYGVQKCSNLCDKKKCDEIIIIENDKEIKGQLSLIGIPCAPGQIDVTTIAVQGDLSATPPVLGVIIDTANPSNNVYCCV